jgi:hypothetical protein
VWSISPSVRTTPAIGLERIPAERSVGRSASWRSRSGDALTRYQGSSPEPITIEDWVRGIARPSRAAAQTGQLQFHWGKPPPAADPMILTRIRRENRETRPRSTHMWTAG